MILVATDFSVIAHSALRYGRRLAAQLDQMVDVLHVVEGGIGRPGDRWYCDDDTTTTIIVRWGIPWVEICHYTGEAGTTLLIVGSHGSRGYHPLALGATASRIAASARCPVLVVGPRAAPYAFASRPTITHHERIGSQT